MDWNPHVVLVGKYMSVVAHDELLGRTNDHIIILILILIVIVISHMGIPVYADDVNVIDTS